MINEREEFEKWWEFEGGGNAYESAWWAWQARAALEDKKDEDILFGQTLSGPRFDGLLARYPEAAPVQQEPVAYLQDFEREQKLLWVKPEGGACIPLYPHPQPDHAEVVADVIAFAVARINATIIVEGETCEKLRSAIAARVADIAKATFTTPISQQPDHAEALADAHPPVVSNGIAQFLIGKELVQFFDEWELVIPLDARERLRVLVDAVKDDAFGTPLPNEPKPCRAGNPSVGFVCEDCADKLTNYADQITPAKAQSGIPADALEALKAAKMFIEGEVLPTKQEVIEIIDAAITSQKGGA